MAVCGSLCPAARYLRVERVGRAIFAAAASFLTLAFLVLELARGACDALGQAVILPLPPGLPLWMAARHRPRFIARRSLGNAMDRKQQGVRRFVAMGSYALPGPKWDVFHRRCGSFSIEYVLPLVRANHIFRPERVFLLCCVRTM